MKEVYVDIVEKPVLASCPSEIRANFLKRVYAILFCQLALTTTVSSVICFDKDIATFITDTPELTFAVAILSLFNLCALFAYKNRHPENIIYLFLFSICQSYLLGTIVLKYSILGSGSIVLCAVFTTMLVFGALSIFVYVNNTETNSVQNFLTMCIVTFIVLFTIGIFIPSIFMSGLISCVGVFLFSTLIIYDTSNMLTYMGPDDTIVAVVQLYLDIINLFLYILQVFQICSIESA